MIEERELVFNTDARVWARAFVERFMIRALDRREFSTDDAEGLMLGWFANAIESGRGPDGGRYYTGGGDTAQLMAVVDAAYSLASNLAEFEQLTDEVYLDMLTNALYAIGRWPQHVQVLREVER